jgi:hypothetical protein
MRTTMCDLTPPDCYASLEQQATRLVFGLCVDPALTQTIDQLLKIDSRLQAPWLLCYTAMECRFRGDYDTARSCGQTSVAQFARIGNRDGRARAMDVARAYSSDRQRQCRVPRL